VEPPEAHLGVREGWIYGERTLVFGDGFVVARLAQKEPTL
jgi:hypothetical protein